MTSQARSAFNKNCEDVDRLLEIHTDITGDAPGRRWKVESLHKSAIVLLTAFWEAFCEDLAAEALTHLVDHAPKASALPGPLQQLVAKELKAEKHDLAIWQLAGDGWRTVLASRLQRLQEERNRKLNTPKTPQIETLFSSAVGIEDVSKAWYWPGMTVERAKKKLDDFITLRGEIAHRGSAANSVTKPQVNEYYNHLKRLVDRTEKHVASKVSQSTGKDPWPSDE
ncbi:MAE_28990/MAE_18760 family HEPN-like nuclease [Streptomyces sp. NPDC002588]|uniref:HEPN domain-containing protein n=1 Tax=Streptomyces sp. NPDC002588 TaxID=3154419 RepID=UPI00331B9B31